MSTTIQWHALINSQATDFVHSYIIIRNMAVIGNCFVFRFHRPWQLQGDANASKKKATFCDGLSRSCQLFHLILAATGSSSGHGAPDSLNTHLYPLFCTYVIFYYNRELSIYIIFKNQDKVVNRSFCVETMNALSVNKSKTLYIL